MTFSITQSFNQQSLPPPIIRKVTSQVSSLAAGDGQIMTAKTYHWDIESLIRPAPGQDIPTKGWGVGEIGAYSGAMNLKMRSTINPLANLFDLVTDSPVKVGHTTREIVSYSQAIKQALEAEQIFTARSILAAIPTYLAGDPGLSSLGQVLALPVVHLTAKRDTDRGQEFNWLRTEGHKYRGQWVAIDGEQLLATAPTLRGLRDQLSSKYPNRSPLIHRIV